MKLVQIALVILSITAINLVKGQSVHNNTKESDGIETVNDSTEIYDFAEVEPEFPGGEQAMREFIVREINFDNIPKKSKESGIVYVQFVVMKSGKVEKVNVVRGVNKQLDEEATRVVKMMPEWKPAEQKGKKINCKYTLPIAYQF